MSKGSFAAKHFLAVVSEAAGQFPYICCPQVKEDFGLGHLSSGEQTKVGRLLPNKINWSVAEFLAFEGSDFVSAVTVSLLRRNPTAEERQKFKGEHRPWVRVALLMEAYRVAQKSRTPITIHGIDKVRFLWRTERFFRRNGLMTLGRLVASRFRSASRRLQREQMPQIALIQLGRMAVERMDLMQDGVDTH